MCNGDSPSATSKVNKPDAPNCVLRAGEDRGFTLCAVYNNNDNNNNNKTRRLESRVRSSWEGAGGPLFQPWAWETSLGPPGMELQWPESVGRGSQACSHLPTPVPSCTSGTQGLPHLSPLTPLHTRWDGTRSGARPLGSPAGLGWPHRACGHGEPCRGLPLGCAYLFPGGPVTGPRSLQGLLLDETTCSVFCLVALGQGGSKGGARRGQEPAGLLQKEGPEGWASLMPQAPAGGHRAGETHGALGVNAGLVQLSRSSPPPPQPPSPWALTGPLGPVRHPNLGMSQGSYGLQLPRDLRGTWPHLSLPWLLLQTREQSC